MILDFIEFIRSRSGTMIKVLFGVLASLVVIDAFVDKHHAHTVVEHIPGFWAVFGFFACSILILVAKWFGRQGIETRENYYD
jgi:hypothetical protein